MTVACVTDTKQRKWLEGCIDLEPYQYCFNIVSEYVDVLQGKLGITNVLEHDIQMVSEKTIHIKNYSLPFTLEETVNKEMGAMLKLKIIEPSEDLFIQQ